MKNYLLKRILISILTIFILITIVWFLVRLLPGDPFTDEKLTPQIRANLMKYYGMDKPLVIQYFTYIKNLLKGDFGYSLQYKSNTVNKILKECFPYSADLGIRALSFGVVAGILLGIRAALSRGKYLDYLCIIIAIVGTSVPNFVIASFVQYAFGVKLKWLPVAKWDGFRYTILPVLALGFSCVAYITRMMRASMLEVVQQDYIKTAKAKGLPPWKIVFGHQIRNAIFPIITVLGPMLATILTGTFVIESIFAIPGLGRYYVQGVQTLDYPLILGMTVFYGVLLVICNCLVDILYGIIDPRVKVYRN